MACEGKMQSNINYFSTFNTVTNKSQYGSAWNSHSIPLVADATAVLLAVTYLQNINNINQGSVKKIVHFNFQLQMIKIIFLYPH